MATKPHVVVCDYIPRPDTTSGGRRLVSIMQILAEQNQVDFAYTDNIDPATIRAQFDQFNLQDVRLTVRNAQEHPRAVFARTIYGMIFAEAWRVAEKVYRDAKHLQPWCSFVVDTVDVHFVREQAAAELSLLPQETVSKNKSRELAVYQAADALVVVTEDDRAALVSEGITKPIFVIPNIVPMIERQITTREKHVSFIGGFRHPPNVDGLLWFVNECWPLVLINVPEAKLIVVGSNPTAEILDLNGKNCITYVGCVPDTLPYLQSAAVSIAPLRYGGGMKGKVCEAMAAGVPVVSTSSGVQGIPACDRREACIADDPAEFAKAVIWLLSNPNEAEELGSRGKQVIEKLCSLDSAKQSIRQLLSWVETHQRQHPVGQLRWSVARTSWLAYITLRGKIKRCLDRVKSCFRKNEAT